MLVPTLEVTPSNGIIATMETLNPEFDFSAVLGIGENVVSAVSELIDTTENGLIVHLPDAPVVVSPGVTQKLVGTTFTPNHSYRLNVTVTITSTKILTAELRLSCPY